jgi:hypothetical protein
VSNYFVERACRCFVALTQDPAWPGLEQAYRLAGAQDDEEARTKLDATCIELSRRRRSVGSSSRLLA